MDASNDVLIEIGRVLRKDVDRATLDQIIEDLQDVPGNKTSGTPSSASPTS